VIPRDIAVVGFYFGAAKAAGQLKDKDKDKGKDRDNNKEKEKKIDTSRSTERPREG
jgi:hypothetical protein